MLWLHLIQKQVSNHINCLLTQLDPLKELDSVSWHQFQARSQRSLNGHFLFPPFLIVFTMLYGIFWFEYEALGDIQLEALHQSRYIFLHQMTPRSIWGQVRSILQSGISFIVIVYVAFALDCRISPRSLMLYDGTNIVVDSKGVVFILSALTQILFPKHSF